MANRSRRRTILQFSGGRFRSASRAIIAISLPTPSTYRGATIVNHNHLLDRVEGMDGIKTGYTRASGFNLLTSVKRDGHYIVAVVLGGTSARARDKIMADLIEDEIENGATVRTASSLSGTGVNGHIAEAAERP